MARWERKQLQQRHGKRSVLSDSSNVGKQESDRFIPKRGSMDIELSAYTVKSISEKGGGSEDGSDESEFNTSVKPAEGEENIMYKSVLSSAMLGVKDPATSHRILSFQDKAPAPKGDTLNNLKVLYSQSKASASNPKLVSRSIPSAPIRVLDAPDLMDDYYLNLLSWSDQNVMAVALGQTVYLWDAAREISKNFVLSLRLPKEKNHMYRPSHGYKKEECTLRSELLLVKPNFGMQVHRNYSVLWMDIPIVSAPCLGTTIFSLLVVVIPLLSIMT